MHKFAISIVTFPSRVKLHRLSMESSRGRKLMPACRDSLVCEGATPAEDAGASAMHPLQSENDRQNQVTLRIFMKDTSTYIELATMNPSFARVMARA
eukprot:5800859-Amphidinium_carterae.1